MMDGQRKYQPITYRRAPNVTFLTPDRRSSEADSKVQEIGTSPSLSSNLKESVLTSFSANPEGSEGFTPYQVRVNNGDTNTTPSVFRTAKEFQSTYQKDRSGNDYKRLKPRIVSQYTPVESRISLGVNTTIKAKDVTSEFGDDVQSQQAIDSR